MKKQFVKPECKFMNLKFESLLHETSVQYGGEGSSSHIPGAKYNNFFDEDEDDLDF